jgi:hypothetical protein
MLTNAEMFKLSGDVARENAYAVEQRTMYTIKLTGPNVYIRARRTYTTDIQQAARFEFMTTALIYAFEVLELAPEAFDVECVAVSA